MCAHQNDCRTTASSPSLFATTTLPLNSRHSVFFPLPYIAIHMILSIITYPHLTFPPFADLPSFLDFSQTPITTTPSRYPWLPLPPLNNCRLHKQSSLPLTMPQPSHYLSPSVPDVCLTFFLNKNWDFTSSLNYCFRKQTQQDTCSHFKISHMTALYTGWPFK